CPLANVTNVSLPGGITGQALAYTSQQYGSWSIVYWILPVKTGTTTSYERVVLYVQNQHGVVSRVADQRSTGGTNLATNAGASSAQIIDEQNQTFLVSFAREM